MSDRKLWALLPPRFPHLFSKSQLPSFQCGDGWAGIVSLVCQRLSSILDEHPGVEIEILQVKEKFGVLRMHLRIQGATDALRAEIRQTMEVARAASERCCERCAAVGALIKGPPMRVRCDACADLRAYGDDHDI